MSDRAFIVTLGSLVLLTKVLHVGGVSGAQQGSDSEACGRVLSLTCASPTSEARLLVEVGAGDRYREIIIPADQRLEVTGRIGEAPSGRIVCVAPDTRRSIMPSLVLQRPEQLIIKDDGQVAERPTPAFSTCDLSVQPPEPTREVRPSYTAADLRAGVDGTVLLHGVVDEQGRVIDLRVVRSLSAGLDDEAKRAFAQWRFRPATRRGKPVAVAVTGEFQFRLRPRSGLANRPLQPASGADTRR